MALTAALAGEARYSILSIIPLFIVGFLVIILLPRDKDKPQENSETISE